MYASPIYLQIPISDAELEFLKEQLQKYNISAQIVATTRPCILIIDEDNAIELRERLIDGIYYYFDKDYELTDEGKISESLIDSIYDALHNSSS